MLAYHCSTQSFRGVLMSGNSNIMFVLMNC